MTYFAMRLMSVLAGCLQALAIVGLCLWPVPAYAAEPDEEELSEVYSRLSSIEQGIANLDVLESELQREYTDPLARARSLDNDPAAIIADVTKSISYLPYAGSLRAADGTLSSRSGNAIDQAVLLATMLNRAGLEARIATGRINAEDAAALVESTSRPGVARPAFSEEAIDRLRERISGDIPDLTDTISPDNDGALLDALNQQQDSLIAALGGAAPPEQADVPEWMTTAAQDYWWVQYRDEPAGTWIDAHPVWPDGKAPPSLEGVEDAYYNALPDSAVQRITIRLEMETKKGSGESKTLTLVELEEVPGSELARNPISLSVVPDTLATNPQADIATAMEEARFMFAALNGERTHDPFNLSGVIIPPEALGAESFGAAALFSTVSDKGESAIAALSGNEDEDVLAIRKLRLSIISEAPGMPDRRDTRILYDATEADGSVLRRDSGEVAAGLTGTYLIGARTGRVSDTGLTSAMIDQARGVAYLIEYDLFRNMIQPDRIPPLSEVVSDLDPSMPLTQLAYAETRIPRSDDLAALRGPLSRLGLTASAIGLEEPSILMPARPLVRMTGMEGMVTPGSGDAPKYAFRRVADLISSPVVAISPGASRITPRDGLRAGLWMSRLEGDITRADADARAYDTEAILKLAREQNIPLMTLTAPGEAESEDPQPPVDELEELELPHKSIAAIRRDLDAGFSVLVPQRLPDGVPYAAWWRVHPETGETLAMLDTGRGAEYQEYLNVLDFSLSVVSTFMIAEDTKKCMSDDFNKKGGSLACCLVTSAIPMSPAGASVATSRIKAGHPAVMFALAFISINAAIMGGITGNQLNLGAKCYE